MELLERAIGSLVLAVLQVGGVVIVLDTFPEIAGVELFNASPLPLKTKEAGAVPGSGVGYAVGPALIAMTEAIGEELGPDDEKNNKLEATCLPVPMLGDDDCGVPTAPSARVEFANGSNSHPNQEKILPPQLDGIPDCHFLLLRCHCKRLVGSAETINRSSTRTRATVKSILQRVIVRVNECTKTFKSRTEELLFEEQRNNNHNGHDKATARPGRGGEGYAGDQLRMVS